VRLWVLKTDLMSDNYKKDKDVFYEKYILDFNRALKLKILGFEEFSFGFYYPEKDFQKFQYFVGIKTQDRFSTLAPTYEQCFDFFREKYNLIHNIEKIDGFFRGYYVTDDEKIQEFIDYKNYDKLKLILLDSIIDYLLKRNRNNLT